MAFTLGPYDYVYRNNVFIYVSHSDSGRLVELANSVRTAYPQYFIIFITVQISTYYQPLRNFLTSIHNITPIIARNGNSGNTIELWVWPPPSATEKTQAVIDDYRPIPTGRGYSSSGMTVCSCCGSTFVPMRNAADNNHLIEILKNDAFRRYWNGVGQLTTNNNTATMWANTSGSCFIITDIDMRIPSEGEDAFSPLTDTLKIAISKGYNDPEFITKMCFVNYTPRN